jgi:hypothetical protein
MVLIYFHTEFHIYISSGSIFVNIKLKATEIKLLRSRHIVILHYSTIIHLNQNCVFSQRLLPYIVRRLSHVALVLLPPHNFVRRKLYENKITSCRWPIMI